MLVVAGLSLFSSKPLWKKATAHLFNSLLEADTLHAIGSNPLVAALTVPSIWYFGVMLAWSVTTLEVPRS